MKHLPREYGVRNDGTIWLSIGTPEDGPHYQFDFPAPEREAKLTAAAPAMLEALENLENDDGSIPAHAWKIVQDAIKLAGGRVKVIVPAPTGNAFNEAVAAILGQPGDGDGRIFFWTVKTDLGRLQVGVTVEDGLGLQFMDTPLNLPTCDRLGVNPQTYQWHITAKAFPDPAMRLRELERRLARVGYVKI